jgi:hypothetical protein
LTTCKIENNRVRFRVASASLAATLLLLAGCGSKHHPTAKRYHVVAHPDTPWQKVITDWYDGRINQRHSCAAVQEAIEHLPFDAYTGTARADMNAYARKVC